MDGLLSASATAVSLVLAADVERLTQVPPLGPVRFYLSTLAPGSRRTMQGALTTIARFFGAGCDVDTLEWARIGYAEVVFLRARLADAYPPATANKALSALRGTMIAAFNLGQISADHLARIRAVKAVRGSRVAKGRALRAEEITALFAACGPTPGGLRDAAALTLLHSCGLRRAEAAAVEMTDLDAETGRLVVRGKGNKERTICVGGPALAILHAWRRHRGDHPGPLLHPVQRNGIVVRRRMTEQAVLALVRRAAMRANVARFSPHDLRRTGVGDLLDAGVDLPAVQRWAGHADPTVTSSYDRRGERAQRRAAQTFDAGYSLALSALALGEGPKQSVAGTSARPCRTTSGSRDLSLV